MRDNVAAMGFLNVAAMGFVLMIYTFSEIVHYSVRTTSIPGLVLSLWMHPLSRYDLDLLTLYDRILNLDHSRD